jgi:hypothetical protein
MIMVLLTNWPVTAVAPKAESVAADCNASTPPVEIPERITMGREPMGWAGAIDALPEFPEIGLVFS